MKAIIDTFEDVTVRFLCGTTLALYLLMGAVEIGAAFIRQF